MSAKNCFIKKLLVFCMLLSVTGCIEPFEPQVRDIPESFVVVDGFINSRGVTTIKLSRTINLSADTVPPAEIGATVYIEEEDGRPYYLSEQNIRTEQNAGTYTSDNITLDPLKKYRLHFITAFGKEYTSDYVSIKITPPLDNITWQPTNTGLQIYVNSHDATNSTLYYRWKYDETWEFTSAYQVSYEYKNSKIEPRKDNIYRCWKTEPSTAIKINSTARLSQDVVSDYPLVTVPANSVKLGYKYSILVKQHALTQEEYVYYETLRKNTESIGTLFDPLPTQLTGNVRCVTNPAEPVIGYVGVRSETQKRIFVSKEELPATWNPRNTGYEGCSPLDTLQVDGINYKSIKDVIASFSSGHILPISPISAPMGPPTLIGYTYASIQCLDCRLRGTNKKPKFWK